MSELSITGKLLKVSQKEQVSDTFVKQEIIIQIGDKYPQPIKVQFVQGNCDRLERAKEGQQVEVKFDLRGREWQGRYFVDLNGWYLRVLDSQPSQEPAPPPASGKSEDDDLPF